MNNEIIQNLLEIGQINDALSLMAIGITYDEQYSKEEMGASIKVITQIMDKKILDTLNILERMWLQYLQTKNWNT